LNMRMPTKRREGGRGKNATIGGNEKSERDVRHGKSGLSSETAERSTIGRNGGNADKDSFGT